ncbi:Splicing factor U2af large subunit B [Apostasia shenzhenica]|uniref:Splicing factor U2af large subunit n=1 Tax=Apostasia shenzhenica TaxID=1088818 RepID=A0A2I0ADI5_9ASPA|nr:Splicing factor U2af large subunit B [Apostasia shenzhenica]
MPEIEGRYEANGDGYVEYGGASPPLREGADMGDFVSQEHERGSYKSRERNREKADDKKHYRDKDRDDDKERDRHHREHKHRSERKERERDRVDEHGHHRSRDRSDYDRDRHRHHRTRDYDDGERFRSHDGDAFDQHRHNRHYDREYDKDSEHHSKHGSRSRSRGKSSHKSRSRSRSGSKSKRISGFDMPPPVMMPGVTAPGQMPGTTTVPAMFPNMFPLAAGQGQFPTLPLMPLQAMTQQATRHARRVYVGGLSATANEQSVATYFNQVMSAIGGNTAGPGDAVVNVYINYEKKFAFVEMRSVEEASNAMALDGIMFEGAPVKVRRPSDYNPSLAAALGPSQPNPNLNLAAVGLSPGSAVGLEGPDRIFVGGLPYYFTEAQVRELLESFGPLRGFDLVKDRETGNSKGYAFCVYQDVAVTDIACAALNGIKMGDKTLTVKRANQGATQPRPEQESVLLQAQQQVAIQRLVFQVGSLPTKIVCLTQVVSEDDLKNDEEYEDILEDMRGEGGKYGQLVNVVVPRPQPNGQPAPGVGRVSTSLSKT